MAGKEMVPVMARPEWLPEGWSVEYRKRRLSNMVDKYYICPLSGKKLRSRMEVMRFLNIEIPDRPESEPAPFDGGYKPLLWLDHHPRELPDGWIVETRLRKNSSRIDSYYIDPISGYKFRSKKDVFRYLANQEVSRVAYRQKRRHTPDGRKRTHTPDAYTLKEESLVDVCPLDFSQPLIEFIKSRVKRTVTRRRLFPKEWSMSNASAEIKIEDPPEKQAVLLLGDSSAPYVESEVSSSIPETVMHLEQRMKNFQIECQDKSAVHEDNLKGMSEIKMLPEPGNEKLLGSSMQLEGKKLSVLDSNLSDEKQLDLPKKQSQANRQTNNEAVRSVIDQPSQRKRKAEIENPMPSQASNQLAGVTVDCETGEMSRREKTRKIDQDYYQDVSITDELREKLEKLKPFVEHASPEKQEEQKDTSETEELREKLARLYLFAEQDSKKQLIDPIANPPFGDSWPDPCIEFAFKTLTSDILVLEDVSTIQDYLNHQLVSSQRSN